MVFERTIAERVKKLPASKQRAYLDAAKNLTVAGIFSKAQDSNINHRNQSLLRKFDEPMSKVFDVVDLFMASITIVIQQSPEISSLVVGGLRLVLDVSLGILSTMIVLGNVSVYLLI